jgi:transposase
MSIIKLREENISILEIARRLQVSKQYVSLVLNEAGQGGRKVNLKPHAQKPADDTKELHAAAKIEGRGEYTMAGLLRTVAERRPPANLPAKRSRKRHS